MGKVITIWMVELIEDGSDVSFSHEFYLDYEEAKNHKNKLEEIYQNTGIRVRMGGEILWL